MTIPNDKALKRAVKEQPSFQLPSNFTYRTMQRIDRTVLLRQKRNERITLVAIICSSLFLVGGCARWLVKLTGGSLRESLIQPLRDTGEAFTLIPKGYWELLLLVGILLVFDHWMRKIYTKHKEKATDLPLSH